eukprot:g315.t1
MPSKTEEGDSLSVETKTTKEAFTTPASPPSTNSSAETQKTKKKAEEELEKSNEKKNGKNAETQKKKAEEELEKSKVKKNGKNAETQKKKAEEELEKSKVKKTASKYVGTTFSHIALLCVAVYALGYWHMSVAWLFILIAAVTHYQKQKVTKLMRGEVAKRLARHGGTQDVVKMMDALPPWVRFPDTDRAEYFNKMLNLLWPHLNNNMSPMIKLSANATLETVKPVSLTELKLTHCDLGALPPRIRGIRTYDKIGPGCGSLDIDLEFVASESATITLRVKKTPITLDVSLTNIVIQACLRVDIVSIGGELPCFDALGISFARQPFIDFSLETLGGMDLTLLPGIESTIQETLTFTLADAYVWPKRMLYPTKSTVTEAQLESLYEAEESVEPVAILNVKLVEAANLIMHEHEDFSIGTIFGKASVPDPYCVVRLRDQETRSKVRKDQRHPKYNEVSVFNVYSKMDELVLTVLDWDRLSDDETIGHAVYKMENFDLKTDSTRDIWLDLKSGVFGNRGPHAGSIAGRIHLQLRLLPLDGVYHSKSPRGRTPRPSSIAKKRTSGTAAASSKTNGGDLLDGGKDDGHFASTKKVASDYDPLTPGAHDDDDDVKRTRRISTTSEAERKMGSLSVIIHRCFGLGQKKGGRGIFSPSGKRRAGSVDPYVNMYVEKYKKKTTVKKRTDDPVYEESFTFLLEDADTAVLKISVRDDEGMFHFGGRDIIGEVNITIGGILNKMRAQKTMKKAYIREIKPLTGKWASVDEAPTVEYSIKWIGVR